MRPIFAIVLISATVCGCARRESAYAFRAPLVSSVRAAPADAAVRPSVQPSDTAAARDVMALPAPHRNAEPQDPGSAVDDASGQSPTGGFGSPVGSRPLSGLGVADTLRTMVGQRDQVSTHLQFAWHALAAIQVIVDDKVSRLATGVELLALASERDALDNKTPLPGDLVVFDRVDGDTEASLVGVVVGLPEREHSTVEFVYLARGVVRRGYVTPSRPRVQRDKQGRVLNTFVRHLTSKGKKSDPFLAGELFHGFIRIDRVAR